MFAIRSAARALEQGRWDGPITRALATIWAKHAARSLVRVASVPSRVAVVCVGGSTLGGSGKTRVAIACARELDASGARVALVGHAYRSNRTTPSVVRIGDALDHRLLEELGDEALVCARSLRGTRVDVVVGPSRQSAIDHAMLLDPDVLVLDGPLRISGNVLSLLAVDAERPWGSGRVVPAGDLRADRADLLACADQVVRVDATPSGVRWQGGARAPLASVRGLRVGLFTAIARPDRLIRALSAAGIAPEVVVSVADHGPLTRSERSKIRSAGVDTWLATEKCAVHLLADPSLALSFEGLRRSSCPRALALGVLESDVVLSGVGFRAVHPALHRTNASMDRSSMRPFAPLVRWPPTWAALTPKFFQQ